MDAYNRDLKSPKTILKILEKILCGRQKSPLTF